MSKKPAKLNSKSFFIFFIPALIIAFLLYFFLYLPIQNPQESDCELFTGVMTKSRLVENTNDIQLKLDKFDGKIFYINNIDTTKLNFTTIDTLVGKEIKVYAVKRFSILDLKNKYNHIAKLAYGDVVIYSEY